MAAAVPADAEKLVHVRLDSGVEFAADVLDERNTMALCFRVLTGLVDEPEELTGISGIVERTLSKGTRQYNGQGLADAFDALGAQWSSASGRQSTLVRVLCLPEFVTDVVTLVGEMIRHPTFPDEACRIAVDLARQERRNLEDEPGDLVRILIQRLTLGPVLGRYPGGDDETLARITPELIRQHWQRYFHAGRIQVTAAGPVDPEKLAAAVDHTFADFGSAEPAGREPADFTFTPEQVHQEKNTEQQYIAMTLPGMPRDHEDFPIEQVVLHVLAGGMSSRLFTEVREKQGLVYWVGAWHEQPRGKGIIHLGASTMPKRSARTLATLHRELTRLGEDLSEDEVRRARDSLIAHHETETDLTRARASHLSDDLFHFSRPIGLEPKLRAIREVTVDAAKAFVQRLPRDRVCVATLGPPAP
ncbi:MAG: pitrilysin family protein [Phycisphaerae bacterium]|jgi:predicted Zn-dependent peptidase